MAEKPDEGADLEPDRPGEVSADDRKRAARIATAVAIPVTLLAAVGVFWLVGSQATQPEEPDTVPVPTESVEVDVPSLSADDAVTCRALISQLPAELGELPQRAVSGDDGAAEVSAAFGEPAVSIRCGVEPVDVAADAVVYPMPPTCWFADEGEDAVVWTTVDRTLPVEIRVPVEHDQSGQLVQAVTKLVGDKIPVSDEVPSGCLE